MSRSWWRCRNPHCSTPGGVVLGRVTANGGLVLDPAVRSFAAYFDSGRSEVVCPTCGVTREFRGTVLRRQ
ncbi:MAG: hypothetical protein AVDCRST_MAG93-5798 [uncultured Chloroflexia bacterium]|uniref:Uncharacterized protein n=1 Tax=uncultured Chloroflexia bacterium TaxID=1672391 RepID=A0A6J4L3R2_9CHLR|nr:MAG: hypothetical protein AVDCRST_MAG93-5798 [uncultured Chloroflexia bacterium]